MENSPAVSNTSPINTEKSRPEEETSYGLEKDVGGLYSGVLMTVLLVSASGLLFSVFIGDVLETADIYCTTFEKIADYSTGIIVYVWVSI